MTFRSLPFLLFIFCLAGQGYALESRREKLGISSYASALESYQNKEIKDAVRQLKAILQREPSDDEAALLLGTIYFENHRLKKAKNYFDRVEVRSLTDESAFAYGMTYLENKSYSKAARGLRYEVRKRGKNRSLAIYYLGSIYYKTGQMARAKRFFQKADPENLPVFLRVNRRRYLSDIRREQNRMIERVSGWRGSRAYAEATPPPSEDDGAWRENEDGNDDDLKAHSSQKNGAEPGWHLSFRPSLKLAQQGSTLDNDNLAFDSLNLVAHKESVTATVNYHPPQTATGLSLQLLAEGGQSSYNAKIQKSRYFVVDQASGVFTEQKNKRESESAPFGKVAANGSLGLGDNFSLELGGSFITHMPKSDSEKAWGQSAITAGMRFEGKKVDFVAEASVQQPFDEGQKEDALDNYFRVDLEYDFMVFRLGLDAYYWATDRVEFVSPDRFRYTLVDPSIRYRVGFATEAGGNAAMNANIGDASFLFSAAYYDRDIAKSRFVNRISTIDSIETAVDGANKFLLSANYPLWDALTVVASGGYNLLTAYLYSQRDDQGNVMKNYLTNVDQQLFQAGAVLAISDWLRFSGSYSIIRNSYEEKDTKEYVFKAANPSEIEDVSFYFELAKTF